MHRMNPYVDDFTHNYQSVSVMADCGMGYNGNDFRMRLKCGGACCGGNADAEHIIAGEA